MEIHIVVIFVTLSIVYCENWIDPYDMNSKNEAKSKKAMKTAPDSAKDFSSDCVCDMQKSEDITSYLFYLKRFVSLLVNHAGFEKNYMSSSNPIMYSGHILINLNSDHYQYLMDFVKKRDIDLKSLRRLDEVLSEGIQLDILSEYVGAIDRLGAKLYNLVFNSSTLLVLGTVLMSYVVYDLFKNNFTMVYILKYLTIIILIVDYGFRYGELLQESERHNLNIQLTSNCDSANMTWAKYFRTLLWSAADKECERKSVTPLVVFLYQVRSLIIVPLHSLGTGFGGFGNELFASIPFPWNIIIGPMLLIFICLILISVLSLAFGTSIKFNLLHILNFEFGRRTDQNREERITGNTLTQILDAVRQRRIEDVIDNQETKTRLSTSKTSREQADIPMIERKEVQANKNIVSSKSKNDAPRDMSNSNVEHVEMSTTTEDKEEQLKEMLSSETLNEVPLEHDKSTLEEGNNEQTNIINKREERTEN